MQRHKIALGYFFLSAFCLMAISPRVGWLVAVLLLGAWLALLAGLGYLAWAWHAQLAVGFKKFRLWLAQATTAVAELIRQARREPRRRQQDPAEGYM